MRDFKDKGLKKTIKKILRKEFAKENLKIAAVSVHGYKDYLVQVIVWKDNQPYSYSFELPWKIIQELRLKRAVKVSAGLILEKYLAEETLTSKTEEI